MVYIPAPRNISDELLETLLATAATNVEQRAPIGVTLSPTGWQSINADVRDLALELKRIRRQVADAGGLAPPRSGAVNRRDVDWSVVADLAKAGIYPDDIEGAYGAALSLRTTYGDAFDVVAIVGQVLTWAGRQQKGGTQ